MRFAVAQKQTDDSLTLINRRGLSKIYKMMISIAGNAIEKQYPITASQIVDLVRQLDKDTANIYENRPLDTEANNALEYAYKNGVIQ